MRGGGEPPLVFAYNLFPPWKTMDAHGEPQGPYTELMREVARRAKLRLAFLPCPLARCLQYMRQGKADVVIGVKNTAGRREFIDFIDPPSPPAAGWRCINAPTIRDRYTATASSTPS